MAALIAIELVRSGTRGRLAAALLLLTLIPIEANRRVARSFPEAAVFGRTAFARLVERRDPEGNYRTLGESFFLGMSPMAESVTDSTLVFSDVSRRSWTQFAQVLWNRGTVINEDFDVGDLSRIRVCEGSRVSHRLS
jgi:hypothetical protein